MYSIKNTIEIDLYARWVNAMRSTQITKERRGGFEVILNPTNINQAR